jgi:hypothetical protein
MPYAFLVIAMLAIALLGAAAYFSAQARVRAAQAEARRLETLVEDVKELAWSHRELDPALATIIIDTIRTAQREDRRQLP